MLGPYYGGSTQVSVQGSLPNCLSKKRDYDSAITNSRNPWDYVFDTSVEPFQALINTINHDKNFWDQNDLIEIGKCAASLLPPIVGEEKPRMEKAASIVREVVSHLAQEGKDEERKTLFDLQEWNWANGVVDRALTDCVFLPRKRGKQDLVADRRTLQSLLDKVRATTSVFVYVAVPGKTPQKVSSFLLDRLLTDNIEADISRLVDLFYQSPTWIQNTAWWATSSLDLVFASPYFQQALDFPSQYGDSTELFLDDNLTRNALVWLNDYAHDLAHAPIDQVSKSLALDLVKAAAFLDMPDLLDVCLRRVLDTTTPNEWKTVKQLSYIKLACILASSQLETFSSPSHDVRDPVEKYSLLCREIASEADTFQMPVEANIPLARISERLPQARKDRDLVGFYEYLTTHTFKWHPLDIGAPNFPVLDGSLAEVAETVRTWMRDNQAYLNRVEVIEFIYLEIMALPDEIKLFTNLKQLTANDTTITSFPSNYCPKNLEVLSMPSSPMTSLPSDFNAPKLKTLNISFSQIREFPPNFNPPNLEILNLDESQMTTLPPNFNPPKLELLKISGKKFRELPANFNPPNLRSLHANFSVLQSLPPNFNPPNLKELYLNNSPIVSLPPNFNPPLLEHLSIASTWITVLPPAFNPPQANLTISCNYRQKLANPRFWNVMDVDS